MKWKGKIIDQLIKELERNTEWREEYVKLTKNDSSIGVHLAIFTEPYLTLLLEGKKTIESRFSIKNLSPFGKVSSGDIILVKRGGGLILAAFVVENVLYYNRLNSPKLQEIEKKFGRLICTYVDQDFWKSRLQVKYGTLINVGKLMHFTPFESNKADRTAWATLRTKSRTLFD
jgi:hypothetical protein